QRLPDHKDRNRGIIRTPADKRRVAGTKEAPMGVQDRSNQPGWSDSEMGPESRFGNAVREGETALCLDCLVTFSVRKRTCPKCGGDQFWLMGKWTQARVRTRPVAVPSPKKIAAPRPMRLLRPAS